MTTTIATFMPLPGPERSQVQAVVVDGWAEVIAAGHGVREGEQAVEHAVVLPGHSPEQALEPIEGFAESDEVKPMLVDASVGHRPPQDERRRLEALLGGSLHVRR